MQVIVPKGVVIKDKLSDNVENVKPTMVHPLHKIIFSPAHLTDLIKIDDNMLNGFAILISRKSRFKIVYAIWVLFDNIS